MDSQGGGLTVAECVAEIRRAGWLIGDCVYSKGGGRLICVVSCVRGERGKAGVVAYGRTETEAWQAALEQVRAMGLPPG